MLTFLIAAFAAGWFARGRVVAELDAGPDDGPAPAEPGPPSPLQDATEAARAVARGEADAAVLDGHLVALEDELARGAGEPDEDVLDDAVNALFAVGLAARRNPPDRPALAAAAAGLEAAVARYRQCVSSQPRWLGSRSTCP